MDQKNKNGAESVAPDATPTTVNDSAAVSIELQADVKFAAFPKSLKDSHSFGLYERATKVPLFSSTDPTTQHTYESAAAMVTDSLGLGIVANGHTTFIDVDHCVKDGAIEPWVKQFLTRLNTYAEFSPSGTGIHAFLGGVPTNKAGCKQQGVEIYSTGRYFTVTGKHVPGTSATVRTATVTELDALRSDVENRRIRPHLVLINKLAKLLSGDTSDYESRSNAVAAALVMLADLHNCDPERMREAFAESTLCLDWVDKNGKSKWERLQDQEIHRAIRYVLKTGSIGGQQLIEEMNRNYVFVTDPKAGEVVLRLRDQFMFTVDSFRACGELANVSPAVHIGAAWLQRKDRREAKGGIVYEPGKPEFYECNGQTVVNRWRPAKLQPAAGDCTLWEQLLEKVLPRDEDRNWLEKWIAYPLQNPGAKLKTAVLLWGIEQGTGKTTIGHSVLKLYEHNGGPITDNDLGDTFNEWALDKQFICADEITGRDGDKRLRMADWLKGFIAGYDKLAVNCKYQRPIEIRNVVNLFMTSNHPNALFLEDTDRRYFVSEVPPWGDKDEREEFFARYYPWLKAEGAAALLHRLLNLDLAGFNPHGAAPLSQSKREMIALSRSELDSWLAENCTGVFKAESKLVQYTAVGRHATAKQVTIGLKRLGGVMRRVKNGGEVARYWTLEPTARLWSPDKWRDEIAAAQASRA